MGMQTLASGIEELRRTHIGDVETMAQVKATDMKPLVFLGGVCVGCCGTHTVSGCIH